MHFSNRDFSSDYEKTMKGQTDCSSRDITQHAIFGMREVESNDTIREQWDKCTTELLSLFIVYPFILSLSAGLEMF